MTDPYLIEGPALISFSGGRTSAYLLKHVLDAYGGTLPGNVIVCFANTGKEMPQTLDFVHDCGRRWNVTIVWLEYDPAGESQRKFRVVDHGTASRQGEPYEALLRERKYLPNPVSRFCTTTLKIRVMRQGQRILNIVQCKDFGEEVGVIGTAKELTAETILGGMTFHQRDGEAPQPT
jgi:3'-phosphoadenosine 5'-phosphosulfate sulfotransferase (PAPS reductase)/FAD synthetase